MDARQVDHLGIRNCALMYTIEYPGFERPTGYFAELQRQAGCSNLATALFDQFSANCKSLFMIGGCSI